MATYKGFTQVQLRKPKRSKFDLSHEKRTSTRMGRLTPIFITETIPNDTFRCNTEIMLRLAPLLAPIFHRVNVFVHYFFVPNRLIWEDWELFITNGRLGTETPPVPPNVGIQSILNRGSDFLDEGSLADHLGMGTIGDAAVGFGAATVDIMPWAAHYKIWSDYYRDRNYTPDDPILPFASGTQDIEVMDQIFRLQNRHWQKEYFTSALPFTQRGNEVLLPLQGSGDVNYFDISKVLESDASPAAADTLVGVSTGVDGDMTVGMTNNLSGGVQGRIENIEDIELTASDVSINDLRRAVRLQEWLERNALAGSRYTESIMAHFARKSSDARLQRAEYLGGGKVNVKISEVVTTAFSTDDADVTVPPANMAGHGIVMDSTNRFTYNCEEHGFIIGIMSVMPTSSYVAGTSRMFFGRNTFLDYPWPTFAHLGEQEVKDYELWTDPTAIPVDRSTQPLFGYQSRYSDWKHIRSSTHGAFRSSLDFWHLARKFSTQPELGAEFVTFEDTLQDRVFAVSEVDTLWCYIFNNCSVIRSLPYFGTPQL